MMAATITMTTMAKPFSTMELTPFLGPENDTSWRFHCCHHHLHYNHNHYHHCVVKYYCYHQPTLFLWNQSTSMGRPGREMATHVKLMKLPCFMIISIISTSSVVVKIICRIWGCWSSSVFEDFFCFEKSICALWQSQRAPLAIFYGKQQPWVSGGGSISSLFLPFLLGL